MSYDIHITRAESWFEDEEPITLAEVEAIWEQLPKGFQIERSDEVSATLPDGGILTVETGNYLIYEDESDPDSRIHIYFMHDVPTFSVRDEKYLLPIIELADLLGAKVQGDEEEVYTKESIMKSM